MIQLYIPKQWANNIDTVFTHGASCIQTLHVHWENMGLLMDQTSVFYILQHPTMPGWMYKSMPGGGKKLRAEMVGFGVPMKSQRHK